jgi:Fe-S-cluster containining protein
MRPENHPTRDAFLAAYPTWKAAVGDAPARMGERLAQGDNAGYLQLHQEQWRKGILCAFNQQGDCTIYPVRPLTCRYGHAVETPSRCSGKSAGEKPAARLQFAPLDDYLKGAQKVLRAAHHALGEPRNRPAALGELVYRQLDVAMAAAKKRERRG